MQCRCCMNEFQNTPILHYDHVPTRAQHFPTWEELESDTGESLDLYQCPFCGLIQLLIEPVEYYKDVIRASAVSDEMRAFRLQYFANFLNENSLIGKKILEVGAGCGEFLEILNASGADGYGIENRKEFVVNCQKKGLKVVQGYLEKGQPLIEGGPFDGFIIMNFLEHVPEPNTFLKQLYSNLSEEAIGLVEVPNVDMILEKNLFSEFMTDHLLYFTEETLSQLLSQNGFHVLSCRPVWHDYCLAAVVQKRKPVNMNMFYKVWEKVEYELHTFIDDMHERKKGVAVWGAGHQALAVISLCNIGEAIQFVIDSAVFKQGKYTPTSHIKVVSPETLKTRSDVGAVIVMAASYSDEVAGILKRDYPNIQTVILRECGLEYM